MTTPVNGMRPIHPGEVLREDYLKPLGMSVHALAIALHVPPSRINDIVLERRGVTVDAAMRLVRYFGGDVKSWLNLQITHDIKIADAASKSRIESEIETRAPMGKVGGEPLMVAGIDRLR